MHRDVGEFVSGHDPVIATVVQLDPLIATYSVPSLMSKGIQRDTSVDMLVGDARLPVKGLVDYVAPVTDAQSGTILIKVRVPNPKREYHSGEKCLLVVGGELPKSETAGQPQKGVRPPASVKPPLKASRRDIGTVQ